MFWWQGQAGNFQTKVLFKAADSQGKGETTAIQNSEHPKQQNFFALLGTPKLHAVLEHILSHIASLIQPVLMIGWKTTIVKSKSTIVQIMEE